MRRISRKWFIIAAIGCLVPLAAVAEEAQKPATATTPAQGATENDAELSGITGKIVAIGRKGVEIRRMGSVPDQETPAQLRLEGGAHVPVSGAGKSRWGMLKKGDLVAASYTKTDPPHAAKVLVLPPTSHPYVAAAVGKTPSQASRQRKFTGWIKQKKGDLLVVRTPNPPPPARRQGEVKEFIRHEGTQVTQGRDSWDALKKGDRVAIEFSKGNPRPADRIAVVLRGGEKPLPPGLATRLFDRRYDVSVRDVDGIGEVTPAAPKKPTSRPNAKAATAQPAGD